MRSETIRRRWLAGAALAAIALGCSQPPATPEEALEQRRDALDLPASPVPISTAMEQMDPLFYEGITAAAERGQARAALDAALRMEHLFAVLVPEPKHTGEAGFHDLMALAGRQALDAARAAQADDLAALKRAAEGLDATCTKCHTDYRKKAGAGEAK